MRGCSLHHAAPEAVGAVHLPLCRVSLADEFCLWDLGYIPSFRAAQLRFTLLLHVG